MLAYGVGSKTAILLDTEDDRWDVMYQFIPDVLHSDKEINSWLTSTQLSKKEELATAHSLNTPHFAEDWFEPCLIVPNWEKLDDDMREAFHIIANKMGRILNGDPWYHDSWHDIVGYAKLVADRLEQEAKGTGQDDRYRGTS
jgi:hypothetical protein